MKYEVPEINISKFSVENIVTASAGATAVNDITAAIAQGNINGATAGSTYFAQTNMNDWVSNN